MRKSLIVFITTISILFFVVGFGNTYDQVKPDPSVIPLDFYSEFSYVKVIANGTAIGMVWDIPVKMYRLKEGVWFQGGSGVIVGPGYVLTAAHVLKPDTIELSEGASSSRISDVIGITSRTVVIVDYKNDPIITTVLYEDAATDLAILTYNYAQNSWLNPIPYPIEYLAEALKSGDVVCAVLHERDDRGRITSDIYLEWGTIAHAEPYAPENAVIAFLNPWDITLWLTISGGDSGSPLFVFRNGQPILIGIIRAIYVQYPLFWAYAVQLPTITKFMHGRR
ncbi:trypsin-like peptidase domain-containing protein [bacterium]|nr:trypsin-like peptidase domain-containing protein [bacterium]